MSKGYDNTTGKRLAKLAQMGEVVFHTSDLGNLWGIEDKNLLYVTLSRYVKKGVLNRIYKGLYCVQDIKNVNPFLLGVKALNRYAYISCETILAKHGVIFQSSQVITIVSSQSRKFSIGGNSYQSRKLSDKYLFNMSGLELIDGFYQATVERAVADMLYFSPHYFFDAKDMIDWDRVQIIQKEIGYDVFAR